MQPQVNYSSGLLFSVKNTLAVARIPFPSLCSRTVWLGKKQADLMAEFYCE